MAATGRTCERSTRNDESKKKCTPHLHRVVSNWFLKWHPITQPSRPTHTVGMLYTIGSISGERTICIVTVWQLSAMDITQIRESERERARDEEGGEERDKSIGNDAKHKQAQWTSDEIKFNKFLFVILCVGNWHGVPLISGSNLLIVFVWQFAHRPTTWRALKRIEQNRVMREDDRNCLKFK